jgi:sporulation protein YlmC with PRC-barrel domain
VVEQNFDPINKTVVNESGDKLGRVDDYTINLKTYMLQKLYVHQSLMKSIIFNNLVIDRTQIIEVTPKQFTVRDATIPKASLASQPIP